MPEVFARYGNILEGGADLTALPCSAKGTFSSSVRRHIENYDLPVPDDLRQSMELGDLTPQFRLTTAPEVTRFVVFCASVFNDLSEYEAIEKIGRSLGSMAQQDPAIKTVEAPILGSGAGGLDYVPAALALAKGFRSVQGAESKLIIFSYDRNTVAEVNRRLGGGWFARLWDATNVHLPLWPGARTDLKKLFSKR